MSGLERYRNLGGVQGAVEPRQMETDVDIFTIKDIGDAAINAFDTVGKAAEASAKAKKEANLNQLYTQLEEINNSDITSSEKDDLSSQLITNSINKGLVSYKDADSIRNMQKRSFADSLSYKREEKHKELAVADEEASLKKYADLAVQSDPSYETRPFEEKVNYGKWLKDGVISMGNSIVSYVEAEDESIKAESKAYAGKLMSRLIEDKIFQIVLGRDAVNGVSLLDAGGDISKLLTPQDLVQMSAEIEPYVHQMVSKTNRRVSPEEARHISRLLVEDGIKRAMVNVKSFGAMTEEMADIAHKGMRIAAVNDLGEEGRKLYYLTNGKIDSGMLEALDIATGRKTGLVEPGKVGKGRGLYSSPVEYKIVKDADGSLVPEVTKPGYMPLNNLNETGKQVAVQNVAQQKTPENISTPEGMANAAKANQNEVLEEGYFSLPEDRRRRVALAEGSAQAPVVAKSLLKWAGEVYKKNKKGLRPEVNPEGLSMAEQTINPIGSLVDWAMTGIGNAIFGEEEETAAVKKARMFREAENINYIDRVIADYLASLTPDKSYIMKDKVGREAMRALVLQNINELLPDIPAEEDRSSFMSILRKLASPIMGEETNKIR